MNRIDKIKFLQGLVAGSVSLSSLEPKRLSMKIGYGETVFMINEKEVSGDVYKNEVTGQLKRGVQLRFKIRYGNKILN